MNSTSIHLPKQYNWKPKEDITAYELALCLPVFWGVASSSYEDFINSLPENARRHFEEVQKGAS